MFLGIDCGTQGLKATAWDPSSREFRVVSQPYTMITGLPPGHQEQHPQIWIDTLIDCVAKLGTLGVDLKRVEGIGISGQQHGFVPLDSAHKVIRPAKLWCDTSTAKQCNFIVDSAGGADKYYQMVGNLLPAGFTASKILWLKENEPDNYSKLQHILLPHDYLNLFLTGETVTEPGDASGTGYFNVRRRIWLPSVLKLIDSSFDLHSCLPRLIESHQPAGRVRSKVATQLGISPQTLVSSGGGDNMMGAIGSGNVSSGVMTVSLGTSGTLYSYQTSPIDDPSGEISCFCDSTGSWLPLACTMNVTTATESIRNSFLGCDFDDFDATVNSIPAGSNGLLMLPYLEGERLPNIPEGTGVLIGLRKETASAAHLSRAVVEGVTLGLNYGLDRFRRLGLTVKEIRLIGGGSRSQAWRQIASDIFKTRVVVPKIEEGPSFGAALQAAWCCSGEPITDLVDKYVELDPASVNEPDLANSQVYEDLSQLYLDLTRNLKESTIFQQHRSLIRHLNQKDK